MMENRLHYSLSANSISLPYLSFFPFTSPAPSVLQYGPRNPSTGPEALYPSERDLGQSQVKNAFECFQPKKVLNSLHNDGYNYLL